MQLLTRSQYRSRAAVAKALAHPSRLLIVDLLRSGEKCAGDLVEAVGAEGPTVSRHLTVLLNAGLVAQDKRGAFVFYRVTCPCIANFFSCMDAVVTTQAKTLAKLA
jgi:ArsR family transcriptional regulator, arsenate/arsenite/antimonite-responsive transcriptional repressor